MMAVDIVALVLLFVLVAVVGLVIGSFLNVVIWRMPRGESLSHPASACPKCGHAIRRRDNIPVLSWLILKGKCRDCGEPISGRYPAVELATAGFFVLVAVKFGFDAPHLATLVAYLYLAAISVALALIDIDTHRLPNNIVYPSYGVAAVLLTVSSLVSGDWAALLTALLGGVALFLFYFVLALVYPRGMGFGDVKLAGILGLYLGYLGWGSIIVGAFAAFLLGGVFAIILLITRRASRKSGIPFGPWMLGGAWVGVFFGQNIASGYLALFGLS